MTSVWSKITSLPGAIGVKVAWGNFPTQFLAPIERLADAIPCDRGQICQFRIVEHGPDDVVGICSNEDGLCGRRQVLKRERVLFRLDMKKLVGVIINSVGGKLAPLEELAARSRLFCIGGIPTIGDAQLPVFFAVASDIAVTDDAMTAVLAHGAKKFLLIVPEDKFIGIVQQDRAAQRGGRIMGLNELLEIAQTGVVIARESGQEALNVWLARSGPAPVRDAEAARFPTPPGTSWNDVTITFKERDIVEIKCRDATAVNKERLHIPGMADATTTQKKPTGNWMLLMAFAARGPGLSMVDMGKLFRTPDRVVLRKKISDLNRELKEYFGINDPPIKMDRRNKHYMPLLTIRQDTNTDLEDWLTGK